MRIRVPYFYFSSEVIIQDLSVCKLVGSEELRL